MSIKSSVLSEYMRIYDQVSPETLKEYYRTNFALIMDHAYSKAVAKIYAAYVTIGLLLLLLCCSCSVIFILFLFK